MSDHNNVSPMDRRQFLRLAAGSALAASGIYGCGSGGGSGNGGGGGGGGISDTARSATFDAIHNFITTLPTPDADGRRQAILDFMRGRPEFEAAGESGDGSLWARFTDNRLYLLIANEDDHTRAARIPIPNRVSRSGPAELPVPLDARILLGVGPNENNENGTIKSLLSAGGYSILNTTGSIYDLKLVNGDGVFYILAHGGNGYDRANDPVFGITSSTVRTPRDDELLADDWAHQRIGYADVMDTRFFFLDDPKTYYLFNENFVREYMSFGPHSVVFIGACNSASPRTPSFNQAVRDKGAGIFIGWTHNTQRRHNIAAALYVFDRLLGANQRDPRESPDQRPFDYFALKADMTRKGLDRSDAAELVFNPGSGGESGLLAPSIKYMDVIEEFDRLVLTGKFGTTQGEVKINGTPMHIESWNKEQIQVRIDPTGANSIGEVIAYSPSGKRKSNSRWLSEWKPAFNIVQLGEPGLKWEGPLNIRIRADAASYREKPGEAPRYRDTIPVTANRETTGRWVASGRWDRPPIEWQVWREFADLVNEDFNPDAKNTIKCFGVIKPNEGKIRLALAAESRAGMKVDSNVSTDEILVGTTGLLHGPYSPEDETPRLDLVLNDKLGIISGAVLETHAGYELTTSWPEANPNPPINESAARSLRQSRI